MEVTNPNIIKTTAKSLSIIHPTKLKQLYLGLGAKIGSVNEANQISLIYFKPTLKASLETTIELTQSTWVDSRWLTCTNARISCS